MLKVSERIPSQKENLVLLASRPNGDHLETLTTTESEIYKLFQKEKKSIDVIAALKRSDRITVEKCLLDVIEKGYPLHLSRFVLKLPQQIVETVVNFTNSFLSNNIRTDNNFERSQQITVKSIQVNAEHNKLNSDAETSDQGEEFLHSGRLSLLQKRFPSVKASISLDKKVCEILEGKSEEERDKLFGQIADHLSHLRIEKHIVRAILIKEWKMRDPQTNSKKWVMPKEIEKRKLPVWFEVTTNSAAVRVPRPLLPLCPGKNWPSPTPRNVPSSLKPNQIANSYRSPEAIALSSFNETSSRFTNKAKSTNYISINRTSPALTITSAITQTELNANSHSHKGERLITRNTNTEVTENSHAEDIKEDKKMQSRESSPSSKQQRLSQSTDDAEKEDSLLQLVNHLTPSKECQETCDNTNHTTTNTLTSNTFNIISSNFDDIDSTKNKENTIDTKASNNKNNTISEKKTICRNNDNATTETETEIGILWKCLNCEIEMNPQQLIAYFRKIRQESSSLKETEHCYLTKSEKSFAFKPEERQNSSEVNANKS
jgi:hypothetical protein